MHVILGPVLCGNRNAGRSCGVPVVVHQDEEKRDRDDSHYGAANGEVGRSTLHLAWLDDLAAANGEVSRSTLPLAWLDDVVPVAVEVVSFETQLTKLLV
jgi:hypothetical protein